MKKLTTFIFFLTFIIYNFNLSAQFSIKYCTSALRNVVNTYELFDGYRNIGYVIQMNRSSKKIKANYIPNADNYSRNLVSNLISEAKDKYVYLASVGAYSKNYYGEGVPVGLCVHDGKLINSDVRDDMDALVIVEEVGGVRVSNIDKGNLQVRLANGNYQKINLKNKNDLGRFINWAKSNNATVFQSHLLISNNKNMISYNGSKLKANRRVLLLAEDNYGVLYHIILYVKNSEIALRSLSKQIIEMYKNLKYDIIAGINLDTGACDYFETIDPVVDCHQNTIHGKQSIQTATNLLYYEYIP